MTARACKALSYMNVMKVVPRAAMTRRRKLFSPAQRAAAELEIALAPTAWPVTSRLGHARRAA
jgi:hypothetical protein